MRRTAFTLTELLVVIATIATLLGLLMPTLQSSREQAKAVVCSSNIHQLFLALTAYSQENEIFPPGFSDSFVPPEGGYAGAHQYDRIGWWWFNYIKGPYYNKAEKRRNILQCPSKKLKVLSLKENILCGNYGINISICKISTGRRIQAEFIGESLRPVDIPHPSRTLLLVDAGYIMINCWHATDTPPVPLGSSVIEDTSYIPGLKINKERDLWPEQRFDATYGRHSRKTVNVCFADGHINRQKADSLLVEQTDSGYKNLIPLWCPK